MARIHTPHPVSGSIGDLTFSVSDGKTVARRKPGISAEKFRTHPRLQRSRENAQAFGGAAAVGCAIYRAAVRHRKDSAIPYAHNHIIALVHKAVRLRRRVVTHVQFTDVGHALTGLDLSRDKSAARRLKATPMGAAHCPHELRVTGLREAAAAVRAADGGHLECRIGLTFLPFPEAIRTTQRGWTLPKQGLHPIQPTTQWIPLDIVPQDGLRLSLHHGLEAQARAGRPQPDDGPAVPILIFLSVEWRAVNEEETEATPLRGKGIIRIAAIQMDAATAQALAAEPQGAKPAHKDPRNAIQTHWRQDPERFLQDALSSLSPQAPPG